MCYKIMACDFFRCKDKQFVAENKSHEMAIYLDSLAWQQAHTIVTRVQNTLVGTIKLILIRINSHWL